jgi:acyl-CoA reductase-like NAD-dependent aldehyde dehydrogenase
MARAHRVAGEIEVGLCWINSWFLRDLRTPFGGSKQSGIGREGGVHSLEFYTELGTSGEAVRAIANPKSVRSVLAAGRHTMSMTWAAVRRCC